MPTYQYRCPYCEHKFEVFQSIVEEPVSECPRCGRKPHRIITGGAGFLLKGSGFYATDHRSESYKQAARKEAEASGGSSDAKKGTKSSADSTAGKPAKTESINR